MKLSYKLSYYVLYVLFAVMIVVLGLFYFGGEMETPIVPEMSNPANTDGLLYLIYGFLAVTVIMTVLAFLFQFGSALKDNPVKALKSLIGVILLAAVLVITWAMGSGELLDLKQYDGTDNVPFWLKISDMFLYTIYTLLIVAILSIAGSSIMKKLS